MYVAQQEASSHIALLVLSSGKRWKLAVLSNAWLFSHTQHFWPGITLLTLRNFRMVLRIQLGPTPEGAVVNAASKSVQIIRVYRINRTGWTFL